MENEIQKKLDDYEKRIQKLEAIISKPRKTKSQEISIISLLITLKEEDFFSQEKTPKEILQRLAEKGHTYKRIQSLTEPLQRATKQGIVNRKKKEGNWVYYT